MNQSKRAARVMAMQVLYAMDVGQQGVRTALESVLDSHSIRDDQKSYGMKLINLVQEHRQELESDIYMHIQNWNPERLAILDKLLLLIGTAELRYCGDVPIAVVLSEMTAIAQKYSTAESARFVNGILEGVRTKFSKL
jgi:transcription antitermination protein NusB